jgi:hypothetical protein
MTRKWPNIPVAIWNDDDTTHRGVDADELRVQREKQLGRPTDEAIKRIFGDLVNDKNLETLRDEMGRFYGTYVERVASSNQAALKEHMQAIVRTSDELWDLLSKPPADWVVELYSWLLPIDDTLSQLHALRVAMRDHLPAPADGVKLWCVVELAGMYERRTGKKATFTNPPLGGDISGEFVDFVRRVSREINIEISLGTIEKAIKARNREIRRAAANKG